MPGDEQLAHPIVFLDADERTDRHPGRGRGAHRSDGGDGDRVELALVDALTPTDVEAIRARLARLDGRAPWTAATLAMIAKRPRVVARELAARLGRETLAFKADVRKLKRLGLTQSFEVGYEISPRGKAYLAARPKRERSPRRARTRG